MGQVTLPERPSRSIVIFEPNTAASCQQPDTFDPSNKSNRSRVSSYQYRGNPNTVHGVVGIQTYTSQYKGSLCVQWTRVWIGAVQNSLQECELKDSLPGFDHWSFL